MSRQKAAICSAALARSAEEVNEMIKCGFIERPCDLKKVVKVSERHYKEFMDELKEVLERE